MIIIGAVLDNSSDIKSDTKRQQLIDELGMIEKESRDFKDSVEDGDLGVLEEL
jgi:hypothetical protein